MKRTINLGLAGAVALLLGGAASAETLAEKTGVNEVLGVSPTTADFVNEVARSDMFEIQSSELAKQKAQGATATFADRMISDHTKTSNELNSLVRNGSVKAALPSAIDDSHQKKLDKLRSLSGADFAKTYIDDQISAHKDAVNLFERYSKGGDSEALKQWAAKTLPTLKEHLKMAQDLNRNRVASP
jgi:putative membrane protein